MYITIVGSIARYMYMHMYMYMHILLHMYMYIIMLDYLALHSGIQLKVGYMYIVHEELNGTSKNHTCIKICHCYTYMQCNMH